MAPFASVAISQYIPTAKHGQAMPAAKQQTSRRYGRAGCLAVGKPTAVLSG